MSDFVAAQHVLNNGLWGIMPNPVERISVMADNEGVKIRVTPPKDTTIENQTICSVKGYRLLIKEGSAPEDENDGALIEDVTDLDKYKSTSLMHTGLQNNVEYFVAAFPFSEYNFFNRSRKNIAKATPQAYTLLGYYEDMDDSNPETRIHYIEMNEAFEPMRVVATNTGGWTEGTWSEENCWIIRGNKPYMVRNDGTIDYELDHDNYAKKADGTPSDVSNTAYAGNAMATIPLIWVKRYTEGRKNYHLFCNIQLDEDYHAYAHTRADGSIEPYTFYPMFGGALISGKLRSIAGQTQMNTQTGANEISYAKANGAGWNVGYYSIMQLRWELETLFTRSTNKQDACGYGNYTGGKDASSLLKTGTLLTGGRFFGYGSGVNKARKFLHCEQQMGAWERINGWLYVGGKHYIKQYEPYNETGAGYINTGLSMSGTSGGYIKETVVNDDGEIPTVLGGSGDTYKCCGGWYNASQVDHAIVGGCCTYGLLCGGAVAVYNLVSNAGWNVSARSYLKTPTTAQPSDIEG